MQKATIRVFNSQFNYQYGSVIHFPYSIASLVAYVKSFPELAERLQFEKTFIFRNKLDEYVARATDVDILLCSCYTWNWEVTTRLAKAVKDRNPGCMVIFGGPQVPLDYTGEIPCTWVDASKGSFFADYPFVDMLVHQEGEHTLKLVLDAYLGDGDYSAIPGIETRGFKSPAAPRIMDLTDLPSPYLTDTVLDLVEPVDGVNYIASWETNRGCPFQCTYCDWGSATKSKVRKREMDVLFAEIEWFADHKISYVDCCDANFGIFADRDLALARKFKEEKLTKGYPGRVRPAWVKASTSRVIPIAKELLDADLLRSVTLAVQSLDQTTLDIVKRSNIKFDRFSSLVKEFSDQKIETYTEIIMGMPGETLQSYLSGLEQIMELFPRPMMFVYNCGVFVNAPMNSPDYMRLHGIKVIKSPIYLWHSSIHNRGEIPEYEYITVGANSFTLQDLKSMYIYGWAAQAFHSMGVLEYIARFFRQVHGRKYVDFYGTFLDYCRERPATLFGREYRKLVDYVETGYAGGGWDHHDPDLAPIYWPIEEATWLRCVRDTQALREGLDDFLAFLQARGEASTPADVLADLVEFQIFLLSRMDAEKGAQVSEFRYRWKEFLLGNGDSLASLARGPVCYTWTSKVTDDDRASWCYKAIWVGRNQGNYKCHVDALHEGMPG